MSFDPQPFLEDAFVQLRPLTGEDHDVLSRIASDPSLWEHHPVRNGHTAEGFGLFFREALSAGALLITDKIRGRPVGCTRFYHYDEAESSVVIGHTFLARNYWGSGYNARMKKLMLAHAFRSVDKVLFYVVKENVRSQKALERLGAVERREVVRNYGMEELRCVVYELEKR